MAVLNSRVVVITGGSSGIGEACAYRFAAAGAKVALIARNEARLRQVHAEIERRSRPAVCCVADVRNRPQLDAAVQEIVRQLGRIDILVNNAGFLLYGRIVDQDEADIREIFETNVFGAIHMIQAVYPHMRRQGGGHIINISSIAGHVAFPNIGIYSATKFALNGVTQALRAELAHERIRVSLVSPSITESSLRINAKNRHLSREAQRPKLSRERVAEEIVRVARTQRPVGTVLSARSTALYCAGRVWPSLVDRLLARMEGAGTSD